MKGWEFERLRRGTPHNRQSNTRTGLVFRGQVRCRHSCEYGRRRGRKG
jgi:hypothetical protein